MYEDPMKKREEFAMSLRKKKTQDLINAKRRKLMQTSTAETTSYSGYSKYKGNEEFF